MDDNNVTSYNTTNHGDGIQGNLTNIIIDEEIERDEGGMNGVQIVYTVVGVLAFITLLLALANLYIWYVMLPTPGCS